VTDGRTDRHMHSVARVKMVGVDELSYLARLIKTSQRCVTED